MDKPLFNAERAFETIEALDYPRVCGSDGEARAMQFLAQEIETLGLEPQFHVFEDWWVEPADAFLTVDGKEISIEPAMSLAFISGFDWMEGQGREVEVSASLAASGEGILAVREECDLSKPVMPGAVGQVLLFDPVQEYESYLWATDFVPSAYVPREYAPDVLSALGKVGVLRWKSSPSQRTFRNLVAEIRGNTRADELIVIGAHLDSFPGTFGSSDDAAGCAIVLEAARHFAAQRPDRTVRCVWFTGEELDRRGSLRFAQDYDIRPETTRLCVNVDQGVEQQTHGPWVQVSGDNMAEWTRDRVKPEDEDLELRLGAIVGSDVENFEKRGVRTFSITGRSRQSAHLPTDRPETIDMRKLDLIGRLSIQAASLASRAGIF